MNRRSFLKTVGVSGAMAMTGSAATGGATDHADAERESLAVLVDTTRCAGCRNCELACAEANGLPVPDTGDDSLLERERKPGPGQWSVINRFETDAGEVFVKRQCMHCLQPACASACLTKAMLKTEQGPVVWREEKCMGCRYCMMSCPFDMPTFEYDSAVPRIEKCRMCFDRLARGARPACVENCPAEALTFGPRHELLVEARRRFYAEPGRYVDRIYGEHEVGGTGWLYLSAVPFEQIGFRQDLGDVAYPELTKGFLYGVPVVLTLWPAFLLALSQATRDRCHTPTEG
ncbi:MAG TPA: 4Fe-4S dicluster domain-containing protein [Candidatus Polarisedimenticolaceae bacterium]|nr:4Fe-4S dicluster domain-containing protein [Candidatus Polarisedimenticolaceae bacterium]